MRRPRQRPGFEPSLKPWLVAVIAIIAATFIQAAPATPAIQRANGPAIQPIIQPVVIDDSPGGEIDTFRSFYAALKNSRVPVILRGICVSACTLILMLPKSQVCVEPTALLGFHLASDGSGTPLPEYTEALIRRLYPKAIRDWLKGQVLTIEHILWMPADEIVQLGVFSPCAPGSAALQ